MAGEKSVLGLWINNTEGAVAQASKVQFRKLKRCSHRSRTTAGSARA
jgi:hypothetical protein